MIEDSQIVIQDDIVGRLRNTPLPYKHALLPLFESVINSIQSIEDSSNKDSGEISIQINRVSQIDGLGDTDGNPTHNPIDGYVVKDNGSGFNETNFKSFTTADSRLKEQKGGKGVGRFIWLKAFETVNINSVFRQDDSFYKRCFNFKANSPAIDQHSALKVNEATAYSEISLCGLRKKYQEKTPFDPNIISQRIIDHCVVYFLASSCPKIILADREKQQFINLNEKFNKEVSAGKTTINFEIKNKNFELVLLYLNSNYIGDHRISLCADGREVKSFSMKKYIPDISGRKLDAQDQKECTLLALVKSKYLNESVNTERTDFNLSSSDDETEDAFDISEKDILDTVSENIKDQIGDFLEAIKIKKLARIREFAEKEEPEYRVLLKHAHDEICNIPDGLDDYKLDTELHKILHKVEIQVKEEGRHFINGDMESAFDNPEYKEKYDSYVDKLLDLRQSELSKYVIHRKTIIDLLGNLLKQREDGKYSLEEEVHKLLYPMKASSDEIDFGQQNLWLLDEKLTYHYYLASDKPFSKMEKVSVESQERPDILVMDRPTSFVEGEYPHHSVVIIELKRPQRSNYPSTEKDPFDQVYGYIEELREGKIVGDDGVHIDIGKDTRFYCYIVADLTNAIRKKAKRNGFKDTIGGDGYYLFNDNYNAYVEVLGYRKLYEDAKKRNRVLFQKLGLSTR